MKDVLKPNQDMPLRAKGLCFSYGDRTVLRGIDLEAKVGEVMVILGANGAGKTTLLRLLAGTLEPQSGEVWLGDQSLARLTRQEVAQRLALAPQMEPPSWHLSVRDVVRLGRIPHRGWWLPFNDRDRTVADDALRSLDLQGLADRSITELSGGELRRVLFARILAQEPRAVLLDEPTAHLDLRHQDAVSKQLRHLARKRGVTVVATLHDLNQAAAYGDRIGLMADGRLLAQGPPETVLTEEHLEAAYGIAVHVRRHPDTGHLWIAPRDSGKAPGAAV